MMPPIPADSIKLIERFSPEMFLSPTYIIQIDGSDDQYMIHKEVLRQRCPFLAKQCDLQPGQSALLLRDPVTKEVLAILIKWMYTDSVHFVKDESEAFVAVRAYLFAKVFDVGTLPDLLLKRLETFYENNTIDDKVSDEIDMLRYKGSDDKLYELLVKQVAKKMVKLNWLGRQQEAKDLQERAFQTSSCTRRSIGFKWLVSRRIIRELLKTPRTEDSVEV